MSTPGRHGRTRRSSATAPRPAAGRARRWRRARWPLGLLALVVVAGLLVGAARAADLDPDPRARQPRRPRRPRRGADPRPRRASTSATCATSPTSSRSPAPARPCSSSATTCSRTSRSTRLDATDADLVLVDAGWALGVLTPSLASSGGYARRARGPHRRSARTRTRSPPAPSRRAAGCWPPARARSSASPRPGTATDQGGAYAVAESDGRRIVALADMAPVHQPAPRRAGQRGARPARARPARAARLVHPVARRRGGGRRVRGRHRRRCCRRWSRSSRCSCCSSSWSPRSGADAGWAGSSPSSCRSSSARARPPAAAGACTGADGPTGTPPPPCAPGRPHAARAGSGLPRSAPAPLVVDAIARAAGRRPADVEALLYGPPPTDDRGLAQLARDLDHLESEVHRT